MLGASGFLFFPLNCVVNVLLSVFGPSFALHILVGLDGLVEGKILTGNHRFFHMGLSENSVPLNPMVNDHYPY
jgi:hypothetical protein